MTSKILKGTLPRKHLHIEAQNELAQAYVHEDVYEHECKSVEGLYVPESLSRQFQHWQHLSFQEKQAIVSLHNLAHTGQQIYQGSSNTEMNQGSKCVAQHPTSQCFYRDAS